MCKCKPFYKLKNVAENMETALLNAKTFSETWNYKRKNVSRNNLRWGCRAKPFQKQKSFLKLRKRLQKKDLKLRDVSKNEKTLLGNQNHVKTILERLQRTRKGLWKCVSISRKYSRSVKTCFEAQKLFQKRETVLGNQNNVKKILERLQKIGESSLGIRRGLQKEF